MAKVFRILVAVAVCAAVTAVPGDAQDKGTSKPKAPAARKAPRKAAATPPAAPAAAPAPESRPATDVRLKTAQTHGAQISYTTTYIQGARQRVEFPGVVAIDQCDLKQSVMLNIVAKRYRVQPYAHDASAASSAPSPTPDPPAAQMGDMGMMGQMGGRTAPKTRGGVVTITTTLSDTLERQPMLGFEARHIKTIVNKQSSATACDKTPLKVEIDAWYVDLPQQAGCARPAAAAPAPVATDPDTCTDRLETRVAGDVKLGFPVKSVTTTTTGEGDKLDVNSSTQEVTELEVTRLDRGLFEIPAGFVEANSSAEIVPALAGGGTFADALFGSTADGSSVAAPKKPGVIRIGVLEPINRTTRSLSSTAMRQELVGNFNKAPYEAIPLKGTSPAEIEQDASSLACDYLLLSDITEVKSSKPGKLGGVMRMTGGGPPKDTHEVKLDYKLFAVGATGAPRLSGNAKASSGGFGVGSALRLAAFAGRLYIGMAGMGMGLGMMNPMAAMSGAGSLGSMGASYFDPRAMAMNSMASGLGGDMMSGVGGMPGMGDPSDTAMRETVSDALENEAKAAMEQLGKKK
jgi:hypothetical protein